MTDEAKKAMLTAMTGEADDGVLSAYLSLSASEVLLRVFPFDFSVTEVPDRYSAVQVEIAAYMLNKRGAEGETSHSENGISRAYEDGSVPPTLLRKITPMVGSFYAKEDVPDADDEAQPDTV